MKKPLILGVDPGFKGALAFYEPELDLVEIHDMPVFVLDRGGKSHKEIDRYRLGRLIRERAHLIDCAYVEKVGAMPVYRTGANGKRERAGAQGAQSAFVFGEGRGIVIGALAAHDVPIREPTPAVWKGAMRVTASKAECRKAASDLAPHHARHWSRVKDDGRAEAFLLACYGARTATYNTKANPSREAASG